MPGKLKPYISRDLCDGDEISWKAYIPGRVSIIYVNTFREACILAANLGKK